MLFIFFCLFYSWGLISVRSPSCNRLLSFCSQNINLPFSFSLTFFIGMSCHVTFQCISLLWLLIFLVYVVLYTFVIFLCIININIFSNDCLYQFVFVFVIVNFNIFRISYFLTLFLFWFLLYSAQTYLKKWCHVVSCFFSLFSITFKLSFSFIQSFLNFFFT